MSAIPLAIHDAIERGSCVLLPDHSGWSVPTEVTRAPCCGQMRALFIVRQRIDASASVWTCQCWQCEELYVIDPLRRATARMFQTLEVPE